MSDVSVHEVGGHRVGLLRISGRGGRPLTWDAAALEAFRTAVDDAAARGVEAIVLLGPDGLGAGADLKELQGAGDSALGASIAERGYDALEPLRTFPVPTIALVAGPALGGALEIGLTADLRIARDGAASMGLPEVRLGLVPGWGGLTRLTELAGRTIAARVAVTDALAGRSLSAQDALAIGVVDVVLAADDLDDFVARALSAVAAALDAQAATGTGGGAATREPWDAAAVLVGVERRTPGGTDAARAAVRLLDLLGDVESTAGSSLRDRAAVRLSRPAAPLRTETVEAFGELVSGAQARNGIASFFALQRARSVTRRAAAGIKWRRVGVVGAGLMATQLAALIAHRTGARVHLVDVDPARADTAVERVRAQLDRAVRAGLDADVAAAAGAATTAGTELAALEGCDAVIEAVVEDLGVKRRVWRGVEAVVGDDALLLTNTSSLSVSAMAEGLHHPERVVGLHFFNPVAVLPLVEVIGTPATAPAALQRTLALAAALGKTAVISADSPGFIVNRLLSRWLSDALALVDAGEDPGEVEGALRHDGLPMTPFQLITHIGPAVQLHILESLHAAFPERFFASASLRALVERGLPGYEAPGATAVLPERSGSVTSAEARERLLHGLADELDRLVHEGVAADDQDVDAAMLLGAGFPPHNGGLSGLVSAADDPSSLRASISTGGHK